MKKNLLNSIQLIRPKSNVFDLTHDVKLSGNMGELIPVMCLDAVPGDKFNLNAEALVRLAPMVTPVMHRIDATVHYFAVPKRIIWENWEKFITNTPNPTVLPAFPYVQYEAATTTAAQRRLPDYFGIPAPIGANAETISALPFVAYQRIWWEYYRDQNLQPETTYPKPMAVDGSNNANIASLFALRRRAWEHDYFTACLPFAQKGANVDIPIGQVELVANSGPGVIRQAGATNTVIANGDLGSDVAGAFIDQTSNVEAVYDPQGSLEVQSTTINDLRRAFRLQEWLEKAARGGSRYIENILQHFGVSSSDKRLQRPEYICGVKSPVVISEVLNTTGTQDLPQGNMSGHGIGVISGNAGNYFCEEHCYIIGVMSIMPKTAYMDGIPKHFLKINDPFEHYWPSFANIGEQEVYKREVYAFQGNSGSDVFGYLPRYTEYKYEPNRVAGDFRTTLDSWTMARKFSAPPSLNETFIQCDPTHRIFAVEDPDVQKIYVQVINKVKARRMMPLFGTPSF